jgi:predicted nucleic acid-binding protein
VNIFLDANVWLDDKHLSSTGFSSLLAYLKRTGSSIILPNLVLEEVLGVYDRTLLEKCEKAFSVGKDVLKYLIRQESPKLRFNLNVDRRGETEALRKRLLEPVLGIKTVQCDESRVDIREVYRRGIQRRRPASKTGEELRDVILWLTVLQYARDNRASVALVTRDSGFWDGENLHAELRGDIASYNVEVSVYKDIESFNKANALRSSPLSAEDVQKLFDVRTLDEQAVEEAAQRLDGFETEKSVVQFRSGNVLKATLREGTLYDVAEGVQFAEVAYQAEIVSHILFRDKPQIPPWLPTIRSTYTSALAETPPGNLVSLRQLAGISEPKELEADVKATYVGQVSMRIVNGTVESADLERFQILEVLKDDGGQQPDPHR